MKIVIKIINAIFKTEFGKKEIPKYPKDFLIIDFSPIALQAGIKGDQNKIIYRYFLDDFGNVIIKKYRYSIARLKALREVFNIPFYDKTKFEQRFPIWAKIMPSEIQYSTK